MRVTLLQRTIYWCDPGRNRKDVERMIAEAPGSDLYVMAEMFATGFCMEPERVAELSADSATLEWMKQLAVEKGCALAGSLAVEENGCYYNRFYFVFPDGTAQYYDKHHLFTYGGEPQAYASGAQKVVINYKGIRMLLQVCYDLRFPVWARNQNDYDVILYVANWPVSRIFVWDTLLRARALENQCYVIGVNRVGDDPFCSYCGHSVAFNAYGKELLNLGQEEAVGSVAIDMEGLQAFRQKFPVLEDRDSFVVAD